MEQKKNIIQILGDFIEAKCASWIFPRKEESLSESGLNILSLLLLIPLFGLLLLVRLSFILFQLLISLFAYFGKDNGPEKTSLISKNNVQTSVYGILIACTIFFSVRILHETAKNRNVFIKENRSSYYFNSCAIEENMPENYILRHAFYAIQDALENSYTNRDVVILRKKLNIDDDFAKGLHFSSPDDFLLYLYSIKEIDKEILPYIDEADSVGNFNNLLSHYQEAALNEFEYGNYYSASAELAHCLNIYDHQGEFPLVGINNKMHLLRLLLDRQWELSTNRPFAEKAYSCFSKSYFSNNKDFCNFDFGDYAKLKDISNNKPFLINVSTYFEGLSQFHNNNHISALQIFESCYQNTTDVTLKQYCALMSIRTAFWNYDKLRNDQSLNLYRKIYKKYSPAITLQYFKPDLERYQSVVSEIINNPQYTGCNYDY